MVGIPHATNKVDQALPSKESLRESSIPNRVVADLGSDPISSSTATRF